VCVCVCVCIISIYVCYLYRCRKHIWISYICSMPGGWSVCLSGSKMYVCMYVTQTHTYTSCSPPNLPSADAGRLGRSNPFVPKPAASPARILKESVPSKRALLKKYNIFFCIQPAASPTSNFEESDPPAVSLVAIADAGREGRLAQIFQSQRPGAFTVLRHYREYF
jgi:hypothetical protein